MVLTDIIIMTEVFTAVKFAYSYSRVPHVSLMLCWKDYIGDKNFC